MLNLTLQRSFTRRSGRQLVVGVVALLIISDAILGILWLLPTLHSGINLRLQQMLGAWVTTNVVGNLLACVMGSPGKYPAIFCLHFSDSKAVPHSCTRPVTTTHHAHLVESQVRDTGSQVLFTTCSSPFHAGRAHQYVSLNTPDQAVSALQYDNFTFCKQCKFAKPPQAHHCRYQCHLISF